LSLNGALLSIVSQETKKYLLKQAAAGRAAPGDVSVEKIEFKSGK